MMRNQILLKVRKNLEAVKIVETVEAVKIVRITKTLKPRKILTKKMKKITMKAPKRQKMEHKKISSRSIERLLI